MTRLKERFDIFVCGGSQHVDLLEPLLEQLVPYGNVHLVSSFLSEADIAGCAAATTCCTARRTAGRLRQFRAVLHQGHLSAGVGAVLHQAGCGRDARRRLDWLCRGVHRRPSARRPGRPMERGRRYRRRAVRGADPAATPPGHPRQRRPESDRRILRGQNSVLQGADRTARGDPRSCAVRPAPRSAAASRARARTPLDRTAA